MKAQLQSALLAITASGVVAGAGVLAVAAQPSPVATGSPTGTPMVSLTEIETRLAAEGVKIREMELREFVVEIEGHDAEGREIELVVDRRSGETLSRRFDD
ncbi:MAG: PepSY domain-containing protein [Steroidobacteraceae bacterium]